MKRENLKQGYLPFQCMIISHVNRFKIEGVATAQYYLLDILATQGEKTTKDLAILRGISQSGISKLTKRLLDKGYIRQERSSVDRRSYNICITEAGQDFLSRSACLRDTLFNAIEQALTPEETKTFAQLCKKIVDKNA